MSMMQRIKLVRAMDTVAWSLNDEALLNSWLAVGVADGDQDLPDMDMESYVDDDVNFAELMGSFTKIMKHAYVDGIYCDKVLSK